MRVIEDLPVIKYHHFFETVITVNTNVALGNIHCNLEEECCKWYARTVAKVGQHQEESDNCKDDGAS